MRQRIHNLTGDDDTGYINTFHGFCVSVLQEDSHAVQYPKSFLVLDNSDIDSMLKIIYEERGLTLRDMTFSKARDMIEMRKLYREPEYYRDLIRFSVDSLRRKYFEAKEAEDIIFYGYLYQEKKCFGLDYNDLIKFVLYIFGQNESIRLKWQSRLEYIMVDEFQDIDELQYELMRVLCAYHGNLFVVGDPDQTIYTWRGADVKYLLDFDRAFPDAKTVMMTENYRSTPQILAAANALISKNTERIPKDLTAILPDGEPVLCFHGETQEAEAEWIAERISGLRERGIAFRDIAVLYRAHYVTRSVENAFLKKEIPYAVYSGVPFFGRMEIKDALSYLRMIVYKDDLSFLRIVNVPKRNIGVRRIRFLQDYAQARGCTLYQALADNIGEEILKRTGAADFYSLIEKASKDYEGRPVSEVLSDILDASGYEAMLRTEGNQERLDNLAELKQSVYEYEVSCGEECTPEHYLNHAALFSGSNAAETGDRVRMMTVHAAKGLEFPYVFLCGMNEGIFPSRKTKTKKGMEEERRLAFVAVTRAEKGLYLSEAEGRNFDGSPRYPSRFLLDIGKDLLTFVKEPREGLIDETRDYIFFSSRRLIDDSEDRVPGYTTGQRVRHNVFGDGTITAVDEAREACVVLFDGMDTPRTISFHVKLKPL